MSELMVNNTKNCAMEIPFSTLSNDSLKTVLFLEVLLRPFSKKSFSKSFDKKITKDLKTFHEVSQLFDQSELNL